MQVVSANKMSGKNNATDGITGATVYTNQDGNVKKVTTDESGLAPFNLRIGNVAVTIVYANHTTLNYIAKIDSGNDYASTTAILFPTSGDGTATIKGAVKADLDVTNNSLENAPDGTGITATIESSQLLGYVTFTGAGKLVSVAYETSSYKAAISGGSYSLTVPASAKGLNINITGDDFEYNTVLPGSTFKRTVYRAVSGRVSAKSGTTTYQDISY